jgi:hypothetical protein
MNTFLSAKRLLATLVTGLAAVFFTVNAFAYDIAKMLTQSIQGATIQDIKVVSIPNDTGLMLIVRTNVGQNQFIMTKEDIVTALALLQNPQAIGSKSNLLENHTLSQLPAAKPLMTASNDAPAITSLNVNPVMAPPTTQAFPQAITATSSSSAPAIVSSTVVASNQQASK